MKSHHSDIEVKLTELGNEPVPEDIRQLTDQAQIRFIQDIAPTASSEPRHWIWKHRLIKSAAAIIILGILFWALQSLNITPDGTTVAIADVITALQKAECIHVIMRFEDGTDPNEDELHKNLQQESHGTEYWETIHPSLSVFTRPNGHITLCEYQIGRTTTYNPNSNTIFINEKGSLAQPDDDTAIAEKWLKRIKTQEGWGAQVETIDTTLDHQSVTLIKVSHCTLGAPNSVLMMYVDPQTQRPTKLYWTSSSPNGSKLWYLFDYPKTWPTNIYAAGAPRDAQVKDITPTQQFSQVLQKIQDLSEKNMDRLPESCIAIKVLSSKYAYKYAPDGITYADVLHLYNGQYRHDNIRYISSKYRNTVNDTTEHFIEKDFASQYQWWMSGPLENYNGFRQKVVFANQHTGVQLTFQRSQHTDQIWKITDQRTADNQDLYRITLSQNHPLIALGNVCMDISFPILALPMGISKKIIHDSYAETHNLICIERLERGYIYGPTEEVTLPKRTLYYLDPSKAYLCTRLVYIFKRNAQWHDDPNWLKGVSQQLRPSHYRIWQVQEYAQTQSGMWYVKKQACDHGNFNEKSGFSVDHPEDIVIKDPLITTVYLDETPEFPEGIFDPNAVEGL